MSNELQGKKVAFLIANEGVEEVELTGPWEAVERAGGEAVLLAPEAGKAQAFNHLDKGDVFEVDVVVGEADPADYDALVLPGGVANPDQLRITPEAVAFVTAMSEAGKPFGVICHGPWTLVEADLVRGRTLTSWPSVKTDIRNAGGVWVDEEVRICTDGPNILVTSRNPGDLPAFERAIVAQFAAAGA